MISVSSAVERLLERQEALGSIPRRRTRKKVTLEKTSEQWQADFLETFWVFDMAGWDKEHFRFSWKDEKITFEEFLRRADKSTVFFKPGWIASAKLTRALTTITAP